MSANLDRHIVTAVLVAHDGARWLPETLKALLTQSQPIQRLVAVDTGSNDRGPAVLSEVVGAGNLLRLPRTTGYGAAVNEALRHPAASIEVPVPDNTYTLPGDRVEWVWLIHDDCAPTTHALRMLLAAAEANPSAVILGPKQRDWHDRRVLTEAGVTIDGAGRRDTGLERREFDQGQHDGLREVFALGTAGLLVRRDVWAELGGLDPELGMFRDDVDFGWRAYAAGHRVMLVTDAVVHHAEATARGLRPDRVRGEYGHRFRRLDRRNAMYVLLAHLPTPAVLGAFARLLFGSLLRTLAFLLVRRPHYAMDELIALRDVLTSPRRLWRARRARASGRKRGHTAFKRFQFSARTVRRVSDLRATFLKRRDPFDEGVDPFPDPDEDRPEESGTLRRLLTRPGALMVLGLLAVTVAAERSLLPGGGLGGGALVPAVGGASDLWRDYLTGWHPVGLGSDAGSPAYVGVLALLSTLLLGKPWLAVAVLLLGGIPLAGMTAYVAARHVVPSPAVRAWLAASYALLPVATGGVAAGRLGTIVVLVLLPLLGLSVSRMLVGPRAGASSAAWASGLLLALAMAFVPLIWLLALVAGALVWLAFGERVRGLGTTMVIALAVPPLLQLPTTLGLLRHPSGFLLEAGVNRPGMTEATLPPEKLLTLDPGGPGTPDLLVTGGVLLVGLAALALRRRRFVILAGWMLALYGFLAAILVRAFSVPQGAGAAPAWPGIALALASIGVLLAAAGAAQWGVDQFARGGALRRSAAVALALTALSAPLLAAVSWIAAGAAGPLATVDPDVVPPFISASGRDQLRPRTLVLRQDRDGRVAYTVLRGRAPQIGESETPVDEAARRRLDAEVAGLAAGRAGDEGNALTRFGIQYILVPGRPDGLARTLDGLPALSRLSRTDAYSTWRLNRQSSRVMLIENGRVRALPSGPVEARLSLPAGSGTRLLLLTEPADGGWHATLNGADVPSRTVDGWAQGYDIPAAGGTFELTRGMWLRHIWLAMQVAGLLVVAALALPGSADRVEEPWAWGRAGGRAGRAFGRVLGRRPGADADTGEETDGERDPELDPETQDETDPVAGLAAGPAPGTRTGGLGRSDPLGLADPAPTGRPGLVTEPDTAEPPPPVREPGHAFFAGDEQGPEAGPGAEPGGDAAESVPAEPDVPRPGRPADEPPSFFESPSPPTRRSLRDLGRTPGPRQPLFDVTRDPAGPSRDPAGPSHDLGPSGDPGSSGDLGSSGGTGRFGRFGRFATSGRPGGPRESGGLGDRDPAADRDRGPAADPESSGGFAGSGEYGGSLSSYGSGYGDVPGGAGRGPDASRDPFGGYGYGEPDGGPDVPRVPGEQGESANGPGREPAREAGRGGTRGRGRRAVGRRRKPTRMGTFLRRSQADPAQDSGPAAEPGPGTEPDPRDHGGGDYPARGGQS